MPDDTLAGRTAAGTTDREAKVLGCEFLRRLWRNRLAVSGFGLLAVVLAAALLADMLSSHDPLTMIVKERMLAPSAQHLMGTDNFGRDIFSRVLHGARLSLGVGSGVMLFTVGVVAGAGQLGKIDQGIFSFWIHSWRAKRPLKYIGFGGTGHQVRDCLHARDLLPLIVQQMRKPDPKKPCIVNVGGGMAQSASLRQLSAWCERRFGARQIGVERDARPFDVPSVSGALKCTETRGNHCVQPLWRTQRTRTALRR